MGNTRGFTFIEVLVASALVAIALLATAAIGATAYGTLDRSGEQTAATVLCQQRIEWLRNQGFASGSLAAGTTSETLTGTYAGYTRTTTITDNTPRTLVKQITVRTTAPSLRQLEITSYLAQP